MRAPARWSHRRDVRAPLRVVLLGWPDPAPERIAGLRFGRATRVEAADLAEVERYLADGHPATVVVVVLSSPAGRSSLPEVLERLEDAPHVVVVPRQRARPDIEPAYAAAEVGEAEPDLESLVRDQLVQHRARRRRREAESTLRATRDRFRNTVERIVDGVVIVDVGGRIRFANSAAHALFGRIAGELVGEELGFPLVPGETAEVDVLAQGSDPRVAELRVAETRWDGEEALLVSMRDITERRAEEERSRALLRERLRRRGAEAALERSEFRARAGRVLSASLDRREILGSLARLLVPRLADLAVLDQLDETTGVVVDRWAEAREDLWHTGLVDRLRAGLRPGRRPFGGAPPPGAGRRLADPDEPWLTELLGSPEQARELGALRPASALVLPLRQRGATRAILSLFTLGERAQPGETDDHLAAEIVERAAVALEQARLFRAAEEASHAKSDFLNVISHELRTPLNGIVGYAELLREGLASPGVRTRESYIEGIERNSRKLLGIIDQILLFARTRSEGGNAEMATEPLQRILDDVDEVMRPMADEAGLELTLAGPREPRSVRTDPDKVRQILIHLVANAIRFTHEGGVRLTARLRNATLAFSVADTGIGIPAERIPSVFEPFTQLASVTTREVGGMGIGLNVVKNLVQILGGTIEVASTPGRGSTFTVRLPQPDAGRVPG